MVVSGGTSWHRNGGRKEDREAYEGGVRNRSGRIRCTISSNPRSFVSTTVGTRLVLKLVVLLHLATGGLKSSLPLWYHHQTSVCLGNISRRARQLLGRVRLDTRIRSDHQQFEGQCSFKERGAGLETRNHGSRWAMQVEHKAVVKIANTVCALVSKAHQSMSKLVI